VIARAGAVCAARPKTTAKKESGRLIFSIVAKASRRYGRSSASLERESRLGAAGAAEAALRAGAGAGVGAGAAGEAAAESGATSFAETIASSCGN